MSSLNKAAIIGHLGADPEIKSFQNGGRIANLRVATSESWKDKATGERKERTEWHTVTISNDGLIGVVEKYLRKGSKVYLEGQLRTRKWQDRDGNDRYSTEITLAGIGGSLIMLDGKPDSGGGSKHRNQNGMGTDDDVSGGGWATGDLDDDVPF